MLTWPSYGSGKRFSKVTVGDSVDWLGHIPTLVEPLIEKSKLTIYGYFAVGTGLVLLVPAARLVIRLFHKATVFLSTRRRALNAVERRGRGRDRYEGDGAWTALPIEQPDNYEANVLAAKILAVSNYKGGVGKTTLSANVAACLAKKHNLRVLFIDLDFQGSGSSMAFGTRTWQPAEQQSSLAARAISGDIAPSMLDQVAKNVWEAGDAGRGRLDMITSHYDLANADTRVLIEWLLRPKERRAKSLREWIGHLYLGKVYRPYDARYILAELLHTRHCRNAYDIVLIDCPPRLTSGSIQALCASSHVLLPTLADWTSAENVVRYAQQLLNLKSGNVCPHINVMGIIPTRYRETNNEAAGLDRLNDLNNRDNLNVPVVPEDCFIPMTTLLLEAQRNGIAYFTMGEAQNIASLKASIEHCAQFVKNRMGL